MDGYWAKQTDYGADCYVTNIEKMAIQNQNFRTALWTGCYLQMTLMCIPPCEDIGLEIHSELDQFIRIEHGKAMVKMGTCKNELNFQRILCKGDGIFIPAGIWHNVINLGRNPLKVSAIYALPNHPKGTIHVTKADVKKEEC